MVIKGGGGRKEWEKEVDCKREGERNWCRAKKVAIYLVWGEERREEKVFC